MAVRSDQLGVHFYTANYLDGTVGRSLTHRYGKHHGFCLEVQAFPDALHKPHFPSIILRPGQVYKHVTEHTFGLSASAPTGPY